MSSYTYSQSSSSQNILPSAVCVCLQIVLREFLNPRGWKPSEDTKFFLDAEQINQLCDVAEQILQGEPSVLRLRGNTTA